jgi:hypothetical protein
MFSYATPDELLCSPLNQLTPFQMAHMTTDIKRYVYIYSIACGCMRDKWRMGYIHLHTKLFNNYIGHRLVVRQVTPCLRLIALVSYRNTR